MRIVVGGTASGTGKTSICLALAAGLVKKGVQVNGFKAGPDYLDPMYMELGTGKTCYNLDPWMSSNDHVCQLVGKASGLALVEGVMGFYDGADVLSSHGSTAHLAKTLNSPVILVANASAIARSFGALVCGFVRFEDSGINIKGVVANNCGSDRHARMLEKVLVSSGLPPMLGAIPAGQLPEIPSRHLGLQVPDEAEAGHNFVESFALAAEKYLDLDMVVSMAANAEPLEQSASEEKSETALVRIGVARDKAFNFYYQANFDILERAGAELVYFSPMQDRNIPEDISMLYMGGGYPEMYAYELSQNKSFRKSLMNYVRDGGQIYAECGGLIYLCQDLKNVNGQVFPMAGVLPFKAFMLARRKSLGYVQVQFLDDCLLGNTGEVIRGHEFHYSQIESVSEEGWENIYQVEDARGEHKETLGIRCGSILAGYTHIYFGHRLDVAQRIVSFAGGKFYT